MEDSSLPQDGQYCENCGTEGHLSCYEVDDFFITLIATDDTCSRN